MVEKQHNRCYADISMRDAKDLVVSFTPNKELHIFCVKFSIFTTPEVLAEIQQKITELKTNSGERENG